MELRPTSSSPRGRCGACGGRFPGSLYREIDSPFGHDGFLVEYEQYFNALLLPFMAEREGQAPETQSPEENGMASETNRPEATASTETTR